MGKIFKVGCLGIIALFVIGIIAAVQTVILGRFYNVYTINAKSEAQRYALLELKESEVKDIN